MVGAEVPLSSNVERERAGQHYGLEMETKQIEVDCPCCAARLTIDVLTRTVLRSSAAHEVDETGKLRLDETRWDGAKRRVEERPTDARDKLEDALGRERGKESRLDDLFDKARRKVEERGGGDST
jgi:hypothetical protein